MFDPRSPNRIINYRPLLFAAVGFIAGIASFEAICRSGLKTGFLAAALILAVAAAGALLIRSLRMHRAPAAVLAAAFLIGLARMAAAMPDTIRPGLHRIEGVVVSVSDNSASTVVLKDARIDGDRLSYRVKLDLNGGRACVGEAVEAKAEAKNPSRRFGAYDERLVMLSSGISVTAKAESWSVTARNRLPVTQWLAGVRSLLEERIETVFGSEADIAAGFLIGRRTGIDEADHDSFKTTGTAHIMSLSGFHVGLITALLLFVLPKRYYAARTAAAGAFLLMYCAVASFTPSLVRASIMCMAVLLADAFMKPRDPLSSLSLAAIAILFAAPYKLWSAGFVLSFSATFGIIAVTSAGAFNYGSRALNKLMGAVAVTLGATAAAALVTARYFGYFPTYALIANITAVPIFAVAVTFSFAVLLIAVPFPGAASVLAHAPRMLIRIAMRILEGLSSLPYASIEVFRPSMLSFLLMLLIIFTVSPFVLRPIKSRIKMALPLFLLFTASLIADIIRA